MILLLAAAVIMGHAGTASAHAVLISSSPTDGSRLDRMPTRISLHFDESVGIASDAATVLDASGNRVDNGTVRSADNGRTVIISMAPSVAGTEQHGRYLVSYRVISADSHVVTGSLRFGVGESAGDTTSPPQPTDRAAAAVNGIATGLGYAGLILAVGTVAIALSVWRSAWRSPRLWRLTLLGSVTIIVGAIVQLITSGSEIGSVRTVAQTLPGRLLQLRILLAAITAPLSWGVLRSRTRPDVGWLRWCWVIASAGLIVVVAAHGHASSGEDRPVALLATTGHLLAMCGWVGGLVVLSIIIVPRLLTASRAGRSGAGRIVARLLSSWSRLAFGCVAVLIVSGEVLAWRQVQPIEALWRTSYGVTLLIKLGLVVLSLAVALFNNRMVAASRRWVRPPIAFTVELSIMAAVIIAATVLSSSRPAVDSYGPAVSISRPIASGQLRVDIDPTHRGPQSITVAAVDGAGRSVRLRSLSGRLSSPGAGVSAVDVSFRRTADGWQSTDAIAPLPGTWQLQLSAGVTGGPAYVVTTDYQVW